MSVGSKMRLAPLCAVALSAGSLAGHAALGAATLRIAAYNVDLDTGTTAPNSSIATALEDVGAENTIPVTDPAHDLDIIGLEETTSNATSVQPIVNSLNTYYLGTGNTYAASSYQATEGGNDPTGGNGPNALIYNTSTLTLLNSTPVDPPGGSSKLGSSSGELREVVRYEFEPVGGSASQNFYVYVTHAKSGSGSTSTSGNSYYRAEEATIINKDIATLGSGASVIVMGDFNIDGTNETVPMGTVASYQQFVAAALVDPINPTNTNETYGSGAAAYKSILTESTQTTFEYRDDLQMISSSIYNGTSSALNYISGSEHAFGNNGSVATGSSYNTAANTDPYKGVLYAATDHLPIVADYTLTSVPEPVMFGMLCGGGLLLLRRKRREIDPVSPMA
jgi:hypothetical protein